MAEKHIDFKVNYRKLRIFEECNTSEIKFPMVLSAPHCGQFFPEEFLNAVKMDINELRSNEDSFVDELVRPASDAGIPMISMNINRAFVDVNRDKIEIDPAMFFNHPQKDLPMGRRCRVGLGVIHRISANNNNIYDGLLNFDEVQERFKTYTTLITSVCSSWLTNASRSLVSACWLTVIRCRPKSVPL